jgi:D-alanine-D-alanine ligase
MKIAVLFGGKSAERDVSIASGSQAIKALRDAGHEVVAIDTAYGLLGPAEEQGLLSLGVAQAPPDESALAVLQSDSLSAFTQSPALRDVEVYFLALHGGTGEDGTLQAFLDVANVAYTGSGHAGSANAMDKDIAKRLFCQAGVPTPNWLMAPATIEAVLQQLGLPVVVKPSKQGSTVGLTVVKKEGDLKGAIAEAYRFDDEVMIEQFIPGRELTVGILEDRALAVGEIIPKKSEIFDYASKYQIDGAEEIFHADLTAEQTRECQKFALLAHRALKLEAYSRIDFRMDADGRFWCLEANSLPGLTAASLLPKSAQAVGVSFPELCDRICHLAVKRHRLRRR